VAIPQTATSVNAHTDKPKQRHGNKARRFSEVEHKSDTSAISEEGMCAHSKDGNWAQVDDASQPSVKDTVSVQRFPVSLC